MRLIFIFILHITYFMSCSEFATAAAFEGAFDADKEGRKIFFKALKEVQSPIILGSYKIVPGRMPQKDLLQAFKNLADRGIPCTIIVEDRLTPEEKNYINRPFTPNFNPLKAFEKTGCNLITDIPAYNNIHFKLLVADNFAMIGTTNFDYELDKDTLRRDFTIFLQEKNVINDLRSMLGKLVNGQIIIPSKEYKVKDLKPSQTELSWGPSQHKPHLLELIELASKEICIYQQDMQDIDIINTLIKKLAQNVKVKILMSEYPFGKNKGNNSISNLKLLSEKGAEICLTGKPAYPGALKLEVHAKVLIVDGKTMYLGSANFYPKVLDPKGNNLNLGVITTRESYISPILNTFKNDWKAHEDFEFKDRAKQILISTNNIGIDKSVIFPTLPLEIEQKHIKNTEQNISKIWAKVKQKKATFTPYYKNKTDDELIKEFKEISNFRERLWYRDPEKSPRISNEEFMIAQALLEKGYYRRLDNIAFEYNNTDSSYNASTVLINNLHFIALQEPSEDTVNLFFKLLINHRVTILVRLKPESEFNKKGSTKYWEDRIASNSNMEGPLKLLISDYKALSPVAPVAIPYFHTNLWQDDKGIEAKELYKLVQAVRKTYQNLQENGPIACHCASGVGRTGTFIAAFTIAEILDKTPNPKNFSIEEIVLRLSIQRPKMIANYEQYITLHRFADYYLSQTR